MFILILFLVANWRGKASMYNPLALARSLFQLFQRGNRRSCSMTKSSTVHRCSFEREINPAAVWWDFIGDECNIECRAFLLCYNDNWSIFWSLESAPPVGWCPKKLLRKTSDTSYLLHFSLSFHSPLPICLFSILLCSNFPFSSQPVWLWRLITILADISFHFLSSSPVLFLASHPLNPTTTHPLQLQSPPPLFSPLSQSFPAIFRLVI